MAEKAKKEEAKEAVKKAKPAPTLYHVLNTVRRQGTRLHRARSATRHRFKLFIAGQRLLRNKKMLLTEEQFEAERDKLKGLLLDGKIALFLPDGVRVTALPDGSLVYTKPNGAMKIVPPLPAGEPKKAPPKTEVEEPEETEDDEPPHPPPEPGDPEEELTSQPLSDLTQLMGIGAGRAKKLEEAGVTSYVQVVEMGALALSELLGVPEELAEEICAAAEEMKE